MRHFIGIMNKNTTINELKNTACWARNQHLQDKPVKKKAKRISKEKTWMEFKLQEFAKETGIELHDEFKFDLLRRWKFDWCFPEIKVAFEYEGIFSTKSRHTTATGFTGDAEKYNTAQQQGWKVLRFTALNYLNLVLELEKIKLKCTPQTTSA